MLESAETRISHDGQLDHVHPDSVGDVVGAGLIRFFGCATCHELAGTTWERRWGPDLDTIGLKTTAAWLRQWLQDPASAVAGSRMPVVPLSERDMASVVALQMSQRAAEVAPSRGDGNAGAGEALYRDRGCSACHRLGESGGEIGPSLDRLSLRLNRPWLVGFLQAPDRFVPNTLMPDYGFSRREAEHVAEYLLSGAEGLAAGSPEGDSKTLQDGLSAFAVKGCSGCHQFAEGDRRVNGKLLQDTFAQWAASPQAAQGVTCQACHMPDRRHRWRGIHDPETVRAALDLRVHPMRTHPDSAGAELRLFNVGAAHHLPTYVTPKILVKARLLDRSGRTVPESEEVRCVGWEVVLGQGEDREHYDTRIPAGGVWTWRYAANAGSEIDSLEVVVEVHPDHFYLGFFEEHGREGLSPAASDMLGSAEADARATPFVILHRRVSIRPAE